MIDLSDISVIDDHCHYPAPSTVEAYLRDRAIAGLYSVVPSSEVTSIQEAVQNKNKKELETFNKKYGLDTLLQGLYQEILLMPSSQYLIRYLSKKYNCAANPTAIDHHIQKRTKEEGLVPYTLSLMREAKIDKILMDTGPSRPQEWPLPTFPSLMRFYFDPIHEKQIIKEQKISSFQEYLNHLDQVIKQAKKEGYVALKTIISYYKTLELREVTEEEAKKAFQPMLAGKDPERQDLHNFQDFMVRFLIRKGIAYDLPIQFHTGYGGPMPGIDLQNSNPLNLHGTDNSILFDEELKYAKIVLLHAGYPFYKELAFLVQEFRLNCYADLSLVLAWNTLAIEQTYEAFFEFSPPQKLLYGSDAYNLAELIPFCVFNAKRATERVLSKLVKEDFIDEDYAYKIANMFFHENTKKLYRL